MVNHYGTLGFGHYISFTKNAFDGKWYKYDDLNREEVSEEKLHKESAYLLFYIRKDVLDKGLMDVVPNIETDYFPGKPIHTKSNTEGFVIKHVKKGEKTMNVKIKSDITDSQLK